MYYINTILVQAVLDRPNSEAANSRVRLTENILNQCPPPPPPTRSRWIHLFSKLCTLAGCRPLLPFQEKIFCSDIKKEAMSSLNFYHASR